MENTFIITTHESLSSLMQETSDNYNFFHQECIVHHEYAQNQ